MEPEHRDFLRWDIPADQTTLKNGGETIIMPKAEERKKKQRQVKVKSALKILESKK